MMTDYIKREDAQDIIARKLSDYITDEERWILEYVDGEIDDIPTADVRENVRGHWVADRYCSVCDFDKYVIDCCSGWSQNFCPNCGADMRGEENDS